MPFRKLRLDRRYGIGELAVDVDVTPAHPERAVAAIDRVLEVGE